MPRFYCTALSYWLLIFPICVAAHPMGNFSIDQSSHLDVGISEIRLRQVLDMAEIPTLQEAKHIDTDKNGTLSEAELASYVAAITPNYLKNLMLSVNGELLLIRVEAQNVRLVAGAANLQTLRVEWDFSAHITPSESLNKVTFRNNNYAERIGSQSITVNRASGVEVFDANAFPEGSPKLKATAPKPLPSPLSVKSRKLNFYFRLLPPALPVNLNRWDFVTNSLS